MARHFLSILLNLKPNLFAMLVILALVSVACAGPNQPTTAEPSTPLPTGTNTAAPSPTPSSTPLPSATATFIPSPTLVPTATLIPSPTLVPTATPKPPVPAFSHIVVIVMENLEFSSTIGDYRDMPNFNAFAKQYTLLTQYYAISRVGSLLNYIAMIGGDTFGVKDDFSTMVIKAPSLPD